MSLEVASLYAKLGLDNKSLSSELKKAKQEMRQFAKEFGDTKVKISVDTSQVRSGTSQAKSMLNKLKTDVANNKLKLSVDTSQVKSQLQDVRNQMKNATRGAATATPTNTQSRGSGDPGKAGAQGQRQFNEAVRQTNASLDSQNNKYGGIAANIKNITQGIILAQTFYKGLNFIQDLAGGAWEMAKGAELAQMSFNTMLKDADVAAGLVDHVKDFAAETSFSFQSASAGAKNLLAYGFSLKEVTEHMRTFGDTAAAMGNPQAFTSIVKAMGQINTKGKVATQEIEYVRSPLLVIAC